MTTGVQPFSEPCIDNKFFHNSQGVFTVVIKQKHPALSRRMLQILAHKDSNLEMTESESAALPFGYGPTTDFILLFFM